MRTFSLLACLLALAPCAQAAIPQCPLEHAAAFDGARRAQQLSLYPSGRIYFTSSRVPGRVLLLQRFQGPGLPSWHLQAVSSQGSAPAWTWDSKWGLPPLSSRPDLAPQPAMLAYLLGPDVHASPQQLWSWLLAQTSERDMPSSNHPPAVVRDGVATLRYGQWGSVRAQDLEFPGRVELMERVITAGPGQAATTLEVQRVELLPYGAALNQF